MSQSQQVSAAGGADLREPPITAPRRRPAVRWRNGQLAMGLFLSTEAMFFGALISSYFVLRWSVAHGNWPSHDLVHLDARIGWLNTVVLLASGWALSRTMAASRQERPGVAKGWLLLAVALASTFLGIKAFEYWEKYRAGILSLPGENAIHDAADLEYLARLKVSFERLAGNEEPAANAATLAANGSIVPDVSADDQRIEALRMLRGALVRWPSRVVGRSASDPVMNQWIIRSTAHLIAPLAEKQELATFLAEHQAEVNQQYRLLVEKLAEREQALVALQGQMAPQPATTELTAQATQVTQQITELKLELGPLSDRRELLEQMQSNWQEGVNHRYELRLPQVIPGGAAWVNSYVMLTGCHALHVVAGIVVLLCLLPCRLDGRWSGVLQNVGWYWLFVDLVWFVVFPLVYLL